jgi:hypothetical protein
MENDVQSTISAPEVFLCLDRLWKRLADTRPVNRLEIPMDDGTRLFEEIRVFDATESGDFGLEREVHYFNTIGRVTEYRADIIGDGIYLSISAAYVGRDVGAGGFHMDPESFSPEDAAQLSQIMARLAQCDWAPRDDQAAEILTALQSAA